MTEAEIVFRYRFRVRETEVDRQQVVFNSRYLEYVDLVIGEFFRWRGVSLVGEDLPLMHVRRAVVEYLRPLHFDDEVRGTMHVPKPGRTSVTFHIGFENEQDGQLAATGEVVYVHVDQGTGRPCPFPADFLDRLLGPGPLDDGTFRS
jgi:acyl-CoA thioester hydrolase